MEDAHIAETNLYALDTDENNNDTKLPLPNHSLYAVFDGHGGSNCADFLRDNLCTLVSQITSRWFEMRSFLIILKKLLEVLSKKLRSTFLRLLKRRVKIAVTFTNLINQGHVQLY